MLIERRNQKGLHRRDRRDRRDHMVLRARLRDPASKSWIGGLQTGPTVRIMKSVILVKAP